MEGKYFRYVFEDMDGCLFFMGSIYNRGQNKTTNYLYINGVDEEKSSVLTDSEQSGMDRLPPKLDIFILGAYSEKCLKKFVEIVQNHTIQMVVLPYLTPMQRMEWDEQAGQDGNKAVHYFLQQPYQFLKEYGIERIYFLYKNGPPINRSIDELEPGYYFEPLDKKTQQHIQENEERFIPVVHAGYVIENDWIFYFGAYEARKNNSNSSVTVFVGPQFAGNEENDSFFVEKEMRRNEHCNPWLQCQKDTYAECSIRCTYRMDHDVIQNHGQREEQEPQYGMFMLGNMDLNQQLFDIVARYWKVRYQIRGVGIPNCGNQKNWNAQIMDFLSKKERIYWICGKKSQTSVDILRDVVFSTVNHRLVPIQEESSCCFDGYLIPKQDVI